MAKIYKVGNSMVVSIPPNYLKSLNWDNDTEVDLIIEEKSIRIIPQKPKKEV